MKSNLMYVHVFVYHCKVRKYTLSHSVQRVFVYPALVCFTNYEHLKKQEITTKYHQCTCCTWLSFTYRIMIKVVADILVHYTINWLGMFQYLKNNSNGTVFITMHWAICFSHLNDFIWKVWFPDWVICTDVVQKWFRPVYVIAYSLFCYLSNVK